MKLDYLIIGLGKTGLSCVSYCLSQGYSIAVTDTRDNPPALDELLKIAPNIPKALGGISKTLVDAASTLLISPGLSLKEPVIAQAIAQGKPYIGDVELFASVIKKPMIGVTGSNAKSTVVTLLGEMANNCGKRAVVIGNVGRPVLEAINDSADLFVLELSSFQLETTHQLPLIGATILNISEDHLDRYDSMNDYIAAKQRIYKQASTAVYNRHDPTTKPIFPVKNLVSFGLDKPMNNDDFGVIEKNGDRFFAKGNRALMSVSEMKLQGDHQVENALACLALGYTFGLDEEAMLETLKTFSGLKHRCQLVREKNGVKWINDSKGTNIGATIAALKGLDSRSQKNIILIAGGLGKDADFSTLKPAILSHVKQLILMGKDAKIIATACEGACEIKFARIMREACEVAEGIAKPGDIVLLSPACASLDMFKNFEHRGDVFIESVNNL